MTNSANPYVAFQQMESGTSTINQGTEVEVSGFISRIGDKPDIDRPSPFQKFITSFASATGQLGSLNDTELLIACQMFESNSSDCRRVLKLRSSKATEERS